MRLKALTILLVPSLLALLLKIAIDCTSGTRARWGGRRCGLPRACEVVRDDLRCGTMLSLRHNISLGHQWHFVLHVLYVEHCTIQCIPGKDAKSCHHLTIHADVVSVAWNYSCIGGAVTATVHHTQHSCPGCFWSASRILSKQGSSLQLSGRGQLIPSR